MKKILFIFISCLSLQSSFGQNISITGKVMDGTTGQSLPLATILVLNADIVVLADDNGKFSIDGITQLPLRLLFNYVGFISDTIEVNDSNKELKIRLFASNELREAEIVGRKQSTEISTLNPQNIELLNEKEILKAACCNLSESFETNPSVDVNYTDAVTGAKEIQLLGLSGIYTQMLGEAIPTLRGLATPYGLMYIPGSWMESIQISKGAGSVANGYEGITGQINVEFKKPLLEQPLLHLNVYGDAFGRAEINSIYTMPLKHDWNYMLMVHASGLEKKNDHNNDDFIDMPLFRQVNVYNRFHFQYGNKAEGQFGIKALIEDRTGGNVNFNEKKDKGTINSYGFRVETKRMEAYSKTGFLFPEKPGTSIGIQLSGTVHDQRAYFGENTYDGRQTSFYNNNIFVSTLGDGHTYKTGVDFKYDYFDETVNDSDFTRLEAVPGAYFEYTYGKDCEKFGAILGSRVDYHNLYGWLYTPRAHLKYNFLDELIVRLSAGRGFRAPNTYSDNLGIFVSSKNLEVLEAPKIEDAWNGGVNMTSTFTLWQREGSFMMDAYYTLFNNQWISDQYSSSTSVYYYNLKGNSSASSIQGTLTYEPLLRLLIKAAWRYNDVRTDYLSLPDVAKPLVSKHKAMFNVAFSDRAEKWRFDATLQWEGTKPLPQAAGHVHSSPETQPPINKSPDYFQLMGQVTRIFKIWEVYLGGENLLNYTQHHVILGNDNPFGDDFDATQIWGPVMGIRVYAGIRLNINNKNHE